MFPGPPAVDWTDERTVIPIRAKATGSRVSPHLGFRSSAWATAQRWSRDAPAAASARGLSRIHRGGVSERRRPGSRDARRVAGLGAAGEPWRRRASPPPSRRGGDAGGGRGNSRRCGRRERFANTQDRRQRIRKPPRGNTLESGALTRTGRLGYGTVPAGGDGSIRARAHACRSRSRFVECPPQAPGQPPCRARDTAARWRLTPRPTEHAAAGARRKSAGRHRHGDRHRRFPWIEIWAVHDRRRAG
jgi:hypothetical protein